jgi:biotin synthase
MKKLEPKEIILCAINNIISGSCNEDCKFCTQSTKYKADIVRYRSKPIETIVLEAHKAHANGALGYCLVTAGKGLDEKKVEYIAKTAWSIKQELPHLNLIACNGTATLEQLQYLKANGVDSYNHNLETSQNYYKEICTTHPWEERYQTCLNAKSAGLSLCSGGIFGMGESGEDRDELLKAIISLDPMSVPLNFFHPNPALPIKASNITKNEAVEIIKKARNFLGEGKLLMVAGGRELLFGGDEGAMFEAGANSIIIGDYLTTSGEVPSKDHDMLHKLGYTISRECERTERA